jgi:TRAP-type uncharacterized transport system fused permease subunit
MAGIVCLSAAFAGHLLVDTKHWERWVLSVAAILMVAPELYSTLIGLVMVAPIFARHVMAWRQQPVVAA